MTCNNGLRLFRMHLPNYVSRETLLKYSNLYNGTDAGTLAKFRYELCASCRHRALCLSVASLREWRLISARSE